MIISIFIVHNITKFRISAKFSHLAKIFLHFEKFRFFFASFIFAKISQRFVRWNPELEPQLWTKLTFFFTSNNQNIATKLNGGRVDA